MGKITGGELLVETLRNQGVLNVFSIIGGQMCSIYDALSRRPDMKLVTVRNEAAAPMMAAGCTAITGIPSVSMCTVGAGVVYEVAGLMAAWYHYLPVISIAPQVQSWKMKPHQENLQGCNQDEIFYPITKWNAIVYHWERIPSLVNRALREAQANSPGPAHLDIPVDILFQTKKFNDHVKSNILPPAANTRVTGALPGVKEDVEKAREAIHNSGKIIVLVGQGMGRPGHYPKIRDHLKNLRCPVLTSDSSSGIMNGGDGSYAEALGLFSSSEKGIELIKESDLLLIIGIDDQIHDLFAKLGNDLPSMIQVEIDPSALLVTRPNLFSVNADPVSFLSTIEQSAEKVDRLRKEWLLKVKGTGDKLAEEFGENSPQTRDLFKGIAAGLTEDDVLVVDGAGTVEAAYAFLRHAKYRNLFIMNTREMSGTGLPFAMGAQIGMPRERVTLMTDKDSLCRRLQELQTACGLGMNLTIVCIDPGTQNALARTEAILDGLGCEISHLKVGESPQHAKSGRPMACLFNYQSS